MISYKTIAEQKLEYLERLQRPLTDSESDELKRAMHAVYMRERRLAQHRNEELALLKRVQLEATQLSRLG